MIVTADKLNNGRSASRFHLSLFEVHALRCIIARLNLFDQSQGLARLVSIVLSPSTRPGDYAVQVLDEAGNKMHVIRV